MRCVPIRSKLALDKAAYADGDTAKVTVTPPAAGKATCWLKQRRSAVVGRNRRAGRGQNLRRQTGSALGASRLYVSALVIRPGERKTNITPKRAVGVLHLPLDRSQRKQR